MFRSVAIHALLCAFITGVVGCSTQGSAVDASEFAQRTKKSNAKQAVKLQPGDSIEISVEVDGRMEVPLHRASLNFSGIATLPIVGDVKVGGLKLDIARAVITKRYGALFVRTAGYVEDLHFARLGAAYRSRSSLVRQERAGRPGCVRLR